MAGNRELKRQAQIKGRGGVGISRHHQIDHAQRPMVGAEQNVLTIVQFQALMIDSARPSTELPGGFVHRDRHLVLGQFYCCRKPSIAAAYDCYMFLQVSL